MKRSRWIEKMVAASETLERDVHIMPRHAMGPVAPLAEPKTQAA